MLAIERTAPDILNGDRRMVEMGFTLEGLLRRVASVKLSSLLPHNALAQLHRSQELLLAGFFFYEIFTEALFRASAAAEVALRERFIDATPPNTQPPRRYAALVRWAIGAGVIDPAHRDWWLEAIVPLRNEIAHGETIIAPPFMFLGSFERLVLHLNAMFPDPALAEHDRQLRLRLDALGG